MNKLEGKYKAPFIADLCRFVKIPSRSFPTGGEEGALQRVVAGEMRRLGARGPRIDVFGRTRRCLPLPLACFCFNSPTLPCYQ